MTLFFFPYWMTRNRCFVWYVNSVSFFFLPWLPIKSVQYIEQSVLIYASVCIQTCRSVSKFSGPEFSFCKSTQQWLIFITFFFFFYWILISSHPSPLVPSSGTSYTTLSLFSFIKKHWYIIWEGINIFMRLSFQFHSKSFMFL